MNSKATLSGKNMKPSKVTKYYSENSTLSILRQLLNNDTIINENIEIVSITAELTKMDDDETSLIIILVNLCVIFYFIGSLHLGIINCNCIICRKWKYTSDTKWLQQIETKEQTKHILSPKSPLMDYNGETKRGRDGILVIGRYKGYFLQYGRKHSFEDIKIKFLIVNNEYVVQCVSILWSQVH